VNFIYSGIIKVVAHLLKAIMYRNNGLIIHECHDDGLIQIVEHKGIRSLHLGSESRQSGMSLDNPDQLILNSVRTMLAWLLFNEKLNKALMLGLGGGTLAKFVLTNFPDCSVTVLESRESIVKLARSHFGLPLDNRLNTIVGDGGHYIRQHCETSTDSYDLLLIDVFNGENMPPSICSAAFFEYCKRLLSLDGVLVINLWDTNKPVFNSVIRFLGQAFNNRVLLLPVVDKGNIIGFAFNDDAPIQALPTLMPRAKELEARFGIEFPALLKRTAKYSRYIP